MKEGRAWATGAFVCVPMMSEVQIWMNFTFDQLRIFTIVVFNRFAEFRLRAGDTQAVKLLGRVDSTSHLLTSHVEM